MFSFSFGVGLHVLLLFIYLALIVVWLRESVHSIVFSVHEGNEAASRLSLILQVYITVFATILLYFIQTVSIRRNLLRRQPLTATHDITAAWHGLGAALSSLRNQLVVNASFVGVSGVVAYLTCLSALHVVTPSLFTLQLFNATSQLPITTTLALPNASSSDFFDNYEWGTAPALPFLSRLQFSAPGLTGPTIFDVLDVSSGAGNATVNATTFNVTCGSVPGKLVSQPATINIPGEIPTVLPDDNSTLTFFSQQTGQPLATIDWQLLPPTMLNSTASLFEYWTNYTRQAILFSTYNFSDSNGVVDSIFALPSTVQMFAGENVPMGEDSLGSASYPYNVSAIQVLGCSLSVIQHTAIVDVSSGNLVETPPVNFSSEWTPLVLVNSSTLDFFDGWASIFYNSPVAEGSTFLTWGQLTSGSDYTNIAIIDSVIMRYLGLPPFNSTPEGSPLPNLTLGMLEDAIANVTALSFWSAARYNLTGPVDILSRSPISAYLVPSEVNVEQFTLLYRVNLNTFQLWTSIILASMLLFLSIILTRGSNVPSPIDNMGFLQTLWLSHRHSKIRKLMLEIEKPSGKELRRKGMTTHVKLLDQPDDDGIDLDSKPLVFNHSSNY